MKVENLAYEHPLHRPRRVLVADGDSNVREALRLLLARHLDFRVVGESHNAAELYRDAAALLPDLILLDWDLRGLQSSNRLSQLRSVCPTASVIVLSTHHEQRQPALGDGASAFVWKGESPAHLLATVRTGAPLA